MNIGIDFYDTITSDPSKFRRLVRGLEEKGCQVFIISAVKRENMGRLAVDYEKSRVGGKLVPVIFDSYFDVPKLKLGECQRLGVSELIDDRADTCKLLSDNGIRGTHYRGWKGSDFMKIYERY